MTVFGTTARRIVRHLAAATVAIGIALGATATPAAAAVPAEVSDAELYAQVRDLEGWMIEDLNRQWGAWFRQQDLTFAPPQARIVNPGRTAQTACGELSSDEPNAFFCFKDETIWLPLDSLVTLMRSGMFGPADDPNATNFNIALIISHEYGHYVQYQLQQDGIRVRTPIEVNGDVGVENFADCAAGYWTALADRDGRLETGDLDSGIRFIGALGETKPELNERDPHGTPGERRDAFVLGFQNGAELCMNRYLGVAVQQG